MRPVPTVNSNGITYRSKRAWYLDQPEPKTTYPYFMRLVSQGYTLDDAITHRHGRDVETPLYAPSTTQTLVNDTPMPQAVVDLKNRILAANEQPTCPAPASVLTRLKLGYTVAGALFNLQTLKDEHLEEYLKWHPKTGQNEVPMDVYLKLRAKGVGHDGAAHQAVKAKNKGKR